MPAGVQITRTCTTILTSFKTVPAHGFREDRPCFIASNSCSICLAEPPPEWIEDVDWAERTITVNVSRQTLENAPEYDPTLNSQM